MQPTFSQALAVLVNLALLATPRLGAQSGTAATPVGPLLELRLAQTSPGSGFVYMESVSGKHKLYVKAASLASDDGMERVRSYPTSDGIVLRITLSPESRERLIQATSTGIGQHIAVLVNSRLEQAAVIMMPMAVKSATITIGLELPAEDAAAVASSVAAKWPISP